MMAVVNMDTFCSRDGRIHECRLSKRMAILLVRGYVLMGRVPFISVGVFSAYSLQVGAGGRKQRRSHEL